MTESVTRNFKVRGLINGQYAPHGGTPVDKLIPNMQVELWYKGPMDVVFLGKGLTDATGEFVIEFTAESPTVMIVNGKISDVFLKVYYGDKIVIGDIDPSVGSFD